MGSMEAINPPPPPPPPQKKKKKKNMTAWGFGNVIWQ